jgi:hypothetical protein
LHVLGWEIRLLELPYVDDVAIEHQNFRVDASQVIANFFGMAAKCAQMQIA